MADVRTRQNRAVASKDGLPSKRKFSELGDYFNDACFARTPSQLEDSTLEQKALKNLPLNCRLRDSNKL